MLQTKIEIYKFVNMVKQVTCGYVSQFFQCVVIKLGVSMVTVAFVFAK